MNWTKGFPLLLACILLCLMVGFFAGLIIRMSDAAWYEELAKPVGTPPRWVFLPVWLIIYVLMGFSLYLIVNTQNNSLAIKFFFIQVLLNFLWPIFFFALQSITIGLVNLALLWFFLGGMCAVFYKQSKIAALSNVPYFLWVTYALYLNSSLWLMNIAGK